MSITDFSIEEVRIRNGSNFTQIPNFTVAGEQLADGQFVILSTNEDGSFMLPAGQNDRVTHFVEKSGVARVTAQEIADTTGLVLVGEPVLAHTGIGVARIPFAESVVANQTLTVNDNGYAVPWSADTGATGAFIIGSAVEDVTVIDNNQWGDAFIDLPAKYSPSIASEEN